MRELPKQKSVNTRIATIEYFVLTDSESDSKLSDS